ncbi:MAG: hypothetical protein JSR30_00235 [Proteobacteria bacterium]|nr:hypothetical protein [Pseudomonadota bacterium]
MNLEHLKLFCGIDETRPFFTNPYQFGNWTYASDGALIVRIPITGLVAVEEPKGLDKNKPKGSEALFQNFPTDDFKSLSEFQFEPIVYRYSIDWFGEPPLSDKLWCVHSTPIDFAGRKVDARYLTLIRQTLGGVKICTKNDAFNKALAFTFDLDLPGDAQGQGLVMPMRLRPGFALKYYNGQEYTL